MEKIINFLKKNKIIISIIFAIILSSFLFFQDLIFISDELKFLIIIFFPLIPQLIDFIIEKYTHMKKIKLIKENLNSINYFYSIFLKDDRIKINYEKYIEYIDINLDEITLISIGEELIKKNYNNIKILIIYFCFLIDYDFTSNSIKSKSRIEISSIFENNNIKALEDLDNSNLNGILEYYFNYKKKLIINDFCEIDKEKIFVQFTEKYLSIINAYYILNLKGKKAQEFQRTLAKLIDEGKIHTKNILGDFKKFKNYNAYLLFSNLLENNLEVKEKLNNYHHIDFKGSLGEYMYKSKILFIKEKINPHKFLKENFSDIYKEHKKIPGFVGLYPIEIDDLYLYPENIEDIIDKENYLKRNYKKLKEFQLLALTGDSEFSLNNSTLEIKEILSNIPINIFIPTEKIIIKNFIVNHYDDLKQEFNIKTIYDWAEINPEDLNNYFVQKDTENISEDWLKISKTVIEEVKKIKEAIKN